VTAGAAYEYMDAGEAEIDQEKAGPFRDPLKETSAPTQFTFLLSI
jgi:hypothetical protein